MTTNKTNSRSAKHKTTHGHGSSNASAKKAATVKKQPKKRKKMILKLFLAFLTLGVVSVAIGIGVFWSYAKNAPKIEDDKLSATVSSKLYDANGVVFEELGAEKRESIQPTEIPPLLADAIISIEDKRFYRHVGVDPIRIIGSAFSNFTKKNSGLQGGSTLTQQLIKLSYFSTSEEDQNLKRKSQEAWMALQLEKKKSKEEILTYYINKVYMANGLYGMETAAKNYYGKTLSELSLPQTALLAGMPQAPNDYNPYTQPEYAKTRRDTVLYTMLENKKISQKEYDEATATPIDQGLQPLSQNNETKKITDNYVKEVIAEVEQKTGKNVSTDGLDIYTNLDMDAQKHLYTIVNTDQYVQYPDAQFQVASTVMDTKTGQVKAQIGGRNIPDDVQLGNNLAVNVTRDVGSTMKPMADYGPAIEYLNYSTGKIMQDIPINYPGTKIPITNADLQFYGSITMRKAIMLSRNTTAVQTFDAVGKEHSAEFLKNIGIEFKDLVAANAISSNTEDEDGDKYGVSSLKLAAAYAAFGNNGIYNAPSYVNKVSYQDGTSQDLTPVSHQAMKDSTAYMMTDMLKDVITGGTAFNAEIAGLIQAGKTGTSNYTDQDLERMSDVYTNQRIAPDSTFVGYTPHYVVSVWTGYNERSTPIPYDYWSTASDVYREMMIYLSKNVENVDWNMPDSVTRIGTELYVKDAIEVPASSYSSWGTYSSSYYDEIGNQPEITPSSDNTPSTAPDPTPVEPEPSTPPSSSGSDKPVESESKPVESAPPPAESSEEKPLNNHG